jgi:hypothetical protein
MYYKFEEDIELFIKIVTSSKSIKDILDFYNLQIHNSYYSLVKEACIELQIEYPVYDFKKNMFKSVPTRLEDILVENSSYKNVHLKKRLFKEGLLKEICYECKITHWNGKKLSLQLDHINGINNDNRLENLRILCPNCHSLTETYSGKNTKKCVICNEGNLTGKSKMHKKCMMKSSYNPNKSQTKIDWPTLEELEKMLEESNYVQVGKKLGVSDNAIRKHIKKYK